MKFSTRVKKGLARIPGVLLLRQKLFGRDPALDNKPARRGAPPCIDPERLKAAYTASPVSREPDTFVLYRIIGNDLVPRHRKGQSRDNVRWILEHESAFRDCEKRWILNRILDSEEEAEIIRLLDAHEQAYLRIPFEWNEYAACSWDFDGLPSPDFLFSEEFELLSEKGRQRVIKRLYRNKNNYLINNNGARNAALDDGRSRAKWVLPWDGNCFIPDAAWDEIVSAVKAAPWNKYFIVPMARIIDNRDLMDAEFRPEANEEPQILFRRDAAERFDENFFYGRRPKVEMLWRLGVPGIWDQWRIEPWDLPCPDYSTEAGQWGDAGWVVRLSSGKPDLEIGHASMNDRGIVRAEAVTSTLDRLDERLLRSKMAADEPIYISTGLAGDEDDTLLLKLKQAADEALTRGPYSVVEKTTLPPSGNPHDYWHPAPYYWPLLRIPGLPYIRRDGRRVPGTRLYEPQSEKYDRTRLQRMFDDTFVLSLAFAKTREDTYASHAARLVRTWFLDPATAMNPNLDYAQVRVGWDRNKGRGSGIIEAKDFYFFLDAVRLLHAAGALSADERNALKTWLRAYLQWLLDSPQGQYERRQLNNHGSYYSLQVGAIAAFVGDYAVLEDMLREARLRVIQQFAPDGRQPEEMKRSATAHYCCFNLQGWINLADLAAACGHDLWSFEGPDGQSLQKAMQWLLEYRDREWPYPQADEFDRDRFLPIHHAYRKHFGELPGVRAAGVLPAAEIKPLFHPHDGIRPFWQLN